MDSGRAPRGTFAPVVLTDRRPPVERWLAVIVVVLLVVLVKPWPAPAESDTSGAVGPAVRTGSRVAPTALPTSSSAIAGSGPQVSAFCLDAGAWLVASVERWGDQRIRVWRAVEPVSSATGPDDPRIPIVPVVSDRLTELGWCAPVDGNETFSTPVEVTVWLRSSAVTRQIGLEISRPRVDRSPLGEFYYAPDTSPTASASSWSTGTYVFRYREDDGRRERWFAVEVEIRARPFPMPSRVP